MARVFTVASAGSVGVVTVHEVQVPVELATVLATVVVPAGNAPTVTVNGTLTLAPAATVTVWVQVVPAQVHPSPVPVYVVCAGTISVSTVVAGDPPVLVTVIR